MEELAQTVTVLLVLVPIFAVAWTVLCVVLFFKVWAACNRLFKVHVDMTRNATHQKQQLDALITEARSSAQLTRDMFELWKQHR